MDLINEYNNKHFRAYAQALNILQITNMTKGQFEELFKYLSDDKYYYAAEFMETVKKLNENFTMAASDGKIAPVFEGEIDFPMSENDEIYLKNVLQSEYAALFIDKEFSEKLEENISETECYDYSKIFYSRDNSLKDKITPEFINKFRIIRNAIREKCYIKFSNTTRTGITYKNQKAFPLKIEFSVLMGKFYVSMWNYDSMRPFKCVLNNLTDIEKAEKNNDFDYKQLVTYMHENRTAQPIEMIVTDKYKNHAVERAKLVFSVYEHENIKNADGTYTIKIWYYTYDEMEIINNIISFGPSVRVVSPDSVVEKIKQRLNYNFLQ